MALIEGRPGPSSLADGVAGPARLSKLGALVVQDGHGGRYYEAVSRGRCYYASMAAGASLGTALTTTAVTLTIWNPRSSGIHVSILECSIGITTGMAAAGTAVYAYAVNVNPNAAVPATNTLAANWGNCLLGSNVGIAQAYTATTLPAAPIVMRVHSHARVIGATPVSEFQALSVDAVDGKIVLAPNMAVTIQAIGTASSGIVSFLWEEIPIIGGV